MTIANDAPLICFLGDATSVHLQRWVVSFLERGFRVHIITRREWRQCPVGQTVLKPGSDSLGWFTAVPQLLKTLSKVKPDIVHAHYVTSYGFWAALSRFHPMAITAWGTDILVTPKRSRVARFLTGWSLRQADLITADSDVMLSEISKYRPAAQMEVIQWGIDIKRFSGRPNIEKNSLLVPQIVSIRMWEPNYNIDVVIKGFKQFCNNWSGTRPMLHLIGGGSQEGRIRQLVQELDLAECVHIHGYLTEEKLINVLSEADISISIPTSDATAMSVLESMAAELPLIASDLPDNQYWVGEDGGMVIRQIEPDAVAIALTTLLSNPAQREQMGKRNRAKVAAEADRWKHMEKMASLYRKLLDAYPHQTSR